MEQQLIDILNKFGEASKHIFAAKILASQITACIWLVVCGVLIYILAKKGPKVIVELSYGTIDIIMHYAILSVIMIGCVVGITCNLNALIAPEYTLILELMRNVK